MTIKANHRGHCGRWIYNYLCNQYLSPLTLWVRLPLSHNMFVSDLRWFSPDTQVSSTNKTDRHDITEILLKVALNTINQPNQPINLIKMHWDSKILLTRGIPIFIEFMDSIVSLDSINLEKQNLKNLFFNSTKKNCWFEKWILRIFFGEFIKFKQWNIVTLWVRLPLSHKKFQQIYIW